MGFNFCCSRCCCYSPLSFSRTCICAAIGFSHPRRHPFPSAFPTPARRLRVFGYPKQFRKVNASLFVVPNHLGYLWLSPAPAAVPAAIPLHPLGDGHAGCRLLEAATEWNYGRRCLCRHLVMLLTRLGIRDRKSLSKSELFARSIISANLICPSFLIFTLITIN